MQQTERVCINAGLIVVDQGVSALRSRDRVDFGKQPGAVGCHRGFIADFIASGQRRRWLRRRLEISDPFRIVEDDELIDKTIHHILAVSTDSDKRAADNRIVYAGADQFTVHEQMPGTS